MQVKLLSIFTSIPFDWLLISWVANYAHKVKPGRHFGTVGKVAVATVQFQM